MNDMRRFRKIFLVEPTHDFSVAKKYTDTVVFMTDGSERAEALDDKIASILEGFDPEQDAVVSMGRTVACLVAGIMIGSAFPGFDLTFGIFRGDAYEFITIPTFTDSSTQEAPSGAE